MGKQQGKKYVRKSCCDFPSKKTHSFLFRIVIKLVNIQTNGPLRISNVVSLVLFFRKYSNQSKTPLLGSARFASTVSHYRYNTLVCCIYQEGVKDKMLKFFGLKFSAKSMGIRTLTWFLPSSLVLVWTVNADITNWSASSCFTS